MSLLPSSPQGFAGGSSGTADKGEAATAGGDVAPRGRSHRPQPPRLKSASSN
ncbi:MAG: hypothetical protein JOZ78_06200 [Chroococcidiopsidaceae cyanobacterium CP_BM_ER_R8_30]|nr:hypothetical protein [Chroococcidiopsidaceae cyanobacterium CP_BM_ER_R8_30]